MENSEVFDIEPLFEHIDDEIIKDLSLSVIHLRYLLDSEKNRNKQLLTENYKLKNEIKITAKRLKHHKY